MLRIYFLVPAFEDTLSFSCVVQRHPLGTLLYHRSCGRRPLSCQQKTLLESVALKLVAHRSWLNAVTQHKSATQQLML